MTRINANIPVKNLCDQHLLAELREIVRIPNTIKSGKAKVSDIPEDFRLGSGHVKFFYDKIFFLKKRYDSLYNEALYRNFNIQNNKSSFEFINRDLYNDWIPSEKDKLLITERVLTRLSTMKKIRYNKKDINFDIAKNKLKQNYL